MDMLYTCDICGRQEELNLFILGRCVCKTCEKRIMTQRLGSRQYKRLVQGIGKILQEEIAKRKP